MPQDKLLYYAWSPDGSCSEGFYSIEDAEDAAYHGDYRYVVVGMPCESIDIVIDLAEENTLELERKDLFELFSDD